MMVLYQLLLLLFYVCVYVCLLPYIHTSQHPRQTDICTLTSLFSELSDTFCMLSSLDLYSPGDPVEEVTDNTMSL